MFPRRTALSLFIPACALLLLELVFHNTSVNQRNTTAHSALSAIQRPSSDSNIIVPGHTEKSCSPDGCPNNWKMYSDPVYGFSLSYFCDDRCSSTSPDMRTLRYTKSGYDLILPLDKPG